MKGGKDEEKVMGPLFPRLHINDAEKGGPKAPPRNKMALYEQLSIPTQRFTSGSSGALPLPHKNMGNSVPSTSSSHRKKSSYSLLGNAPAPHLAERLHSHTSVGAILDTSSKIRAGHLKLPSERDSANLSIAPRFSNFQPHNFSNFKSTSTKRHREEEDCSVPGFLQLENTLNSVGDPRKKDDFGRVRTSSQLRSTSDLFSKHHISNKVILEKGLRADTENILEKSNSCALRIDDRNRSNDSGDLQIVEAEKDAEITETCNLDAVSGVTISPDDVVEAMGPKQFLKARTAIVQQQKVFAVQVFELHRLIKVQKLFAENPDILMEDKFFVGKPSTQGSSKKLYIENVPELPPITPKPRDNPQIPNPMTDNINKGLNNLFPNYKPSSSTDSIPPPWSFPPPPPGNQWLVPVMSPSEGLIYKPYTGPCPPTTGFPGPVQGGPMGLGEDYLRFGFFPPYCMPSLNASISSSAVGPVGPLHKVRPTGPSGSFSPYGSTASSPDIKLHGKALPLFPTTPTPQALENKSEKTQTLMDCTRVIKVVPHNARSASESAARIFRSIQEERRQLE